MTEKTIAKFKYENNTYKLLEVTIEYIGTDGIPTDLKIINYLIVKNRKRLTWTKWKWIAKKKFANLIAEELLQTKINYDRIG